MTDREILNLYLAREECAIVQTKHRFGTFLRSLAWNILRCWEDVDECENDTYLAAWEHIPPAEPEPLRPYLGRTTRNIALHRHAYYAADKRTVRWSVHLKSWTPVWPRRMMWPISLMRSSSARALTHSCARSHAARG